MAPYKDTEYSKEHKRAYYLANREEIRKKAAARYLLNPQPARDKSREWLRNNKDKRMVQCIKYRKKHKYEMIEKSRKRNEEIKRIVLGHYSGGEAACAVCGISDIDVLQLDHINDGGSEHRRSLKCSGGVAFYRRLRVQGLPDGYQVLCANCNVKKELTRRRPWLKYLDS
jgi:hypothetical protein